MRQVLADFLTDLRHGLRQIRKNLSLTIICAAVLAIGIGSATAVFAVLYDAILKPLPYRDAGQLVFVHNEFPSSQHGQTPESAPDYRDLSTHHEMFSETAAYYFNDFTMTGAGAAQHVDAVNASATLFPMLGIAPQLGRTFSTDEDRDGAAKVVILSDAFWRSDFGADRNILSRSITLDEVPYRVIGVMPADFNFPYAATQMWVPLALRPSQLSEDEREDKWLQMVARVAPGLTPRRADAALAQVSHGYAKTYPDDYPEKTGWRFSCAPVVEQQTRAVRGWLLLAFGAVFCVLLIACINISGLLLVRASVRRGEWAVRAALGASRMRLVRQIFAETALLALTGCAAGIALSTALVSLSNRFGPIHRTAIEPWILVFSLGLCLLATFVAGILPATVFSRLPLEQVLRSSGPRASSTGGRLRRVLVSGQLAIAIALLFTATALSRSFVKLLNVPPGFSPEHVWTASIQLPQRHDANASSSFFEDLTRRISALPGIESASAGNIPFSPDGMWTADLYFPGRSMPAARPAATFDIVLPGYFNTLNIPLLMGRTFSPADGANTRAVAVVNQAFVRKYFSSEEPLGKLVANNGTQDKPYMIIGVIDDVAGLQLDAPAPPEIYLSQLQFGQSATFLVVREAPGQDVTQAVRDTLRSMDSSVALFDVETMPARIRESVKLRRFVAWLLDSFAFVGVLLAALGLYGTLAHLLELRRREIAIRMALGASAANVRSLIVRHSLSIALTGLIPGLLLSFFAIRATRSFLFGISMLDGWTLAATALAVFALALTASWIPVARAARVNALAALREE